MHTVCNSRSCSEVISFQRALLLTCSHCSFFFDQGEHSERFDDALPFRILSSIHHFNELSSKLNQFRLNLNLSTSSLWKARAMGECLWLPGIHHLRTVSVAVVHLAFVQRGPLSQ